MKAGSWLAWWLTVAACGADPDAATVRLLRHRLEPGDTLAGPLAPQLAPRVGVVAQEDGGLWVGPAELSPGVGWAKVPGAPSHRAVYRRRTPVPAEVALIADLPGDALGDPVFPAALLHPPARPGGILLAEVAVQLPARHPTRVCVVGDLHGEVLEFGELLDGGVPTPPGEGPTPWIRARILAPIPAHVPAGPATLGLRLTNCTTGSALAPPAKWAIELGRWGDPPESAWVIRSGTPSPDAAWPTRPPPRSGLHRLPDGRMEVREGPPLPRIERGEAWGLLVTAPWDPSGWDPASWADPSAGTVGPISALVPWFGEADAAVFGLDAPATRAGRRARVGPPPARRVDPELFGLLRTSGLGGVLPGPRARDAGEEGWTGTWAEAAAAGLAAGPTPVLDVGDGERAVRVVLVPTTAEQAASDLAAARAAQPTALVIAQVEGPATLDLVRVVAAGADAGQILADGPDPGPMVVWDGVPVWMGMPRISASDREGWAVRWYVGQAGVVRADVIGLLQRGGRWERDAEGALRPRLVSLQATSAEYGTEVVVGRSIAAVDARAHAPDRAVGPFKAGGADRQAPPLPPATTCPEPPEAGVAGTVLGSRLALESAGRAGDRVRLVWRAEGPLRRPEVWLSTPDGAWKVRFRPCEGAEGFETWAPGRRGLDLVDLTELAEPAPPGPLLLQVKDEGEALLPATGSRWVTIPAGP